MSGLHNPGAVIQHGSFTPPWLTDTGNDAEGRTWAELSCTMSLDKCHVNTACQRNDTMAEANAA